MKFFLKTYGCKVNQYESQLIREGLLSQGHEETCNIESADICYINTCTVTAKADKECREILRSIRKRNPDAKIIAMGCYIEADSYAIKNIDNNIETLDNKEKLQFSSKGINFFKGHTRAFIKIQDGCNNFCSYCKVPIVRGRSRSRDPEEVISEANALVKNGYRELVLTGICLGDFGKYSDKNLCLHDLVQRVSGIEGDFRIRLSSIELPDATDALVGQMRPLEKLCRHLHIPLQSGDDDILKQMNRKYTSSDFISRISRIRSIIPDIGITTDIIVGFPGESDLNFKNTVRTIERIRPSRSHIFTYSPRPGTRAFLLKDNIPFKVKRQRMTEIKSLTDNFSKDFESSLSGSNRRVLIEHRRDKATGMLCGYTDNYVKVLINGPDNLMGTFAWHK